MPQNTSSKHSKHGHTQSVLSRDKCEARVQQALAKLNAGQHVSNATAAAAHGVAKTTLIDHRQGKPPKKEAQNVQQALSPAAETALVKHIKHCAAGGFLLNPANV